MRRCILLTTSSVIAATAMMSIVSLTNKCRFYHNSKNNNNTNKKSVHYKGKSKFANTQKAHSQHLPNQFVATSSQKLSHTQELSETKLKRNDIIDNDETNTSTSNKERRKTMEHESQHKEEVGWRYETVDSTTGQTELEKVYDHQLKFIHRILASPLPHLPPDGNVQPDFFVGFAYYSYTSRDLYRSIIAHALVLPVNAIKLSVSWSGRFAVKHFNRVQKVCGVLIDREILQNTEYAADWHGNNLKSKHGCSINTDKNCKKGSILEMNSDTTNEEMKSHDKLPELPPSLLAQIDVLINQVNKRNDERWLKYHLVQASPPIPEVEFALHNTENQLLQNLFDWIKCVTLQRHVVVVVYGSCANYSHKEEEEGFSKDQITKIVMNCVDDMQLQFTWIQSKWLKIFHKRKVIPLVISINELASMLLEHILCKANVAPIQSQNVQNSLPEKTTLEGVNIEGNCVEQSDSNVSKDECSDNVEVNRNVNEIWELFSHSDQASLTRFVNSVIKLGEDGSEYANKERKINTSKLLSYNNILCLLDMIDVQEQESTVSHNEENKVELADFMCVLKLLHCIKRALLLHEYGAHDASVTNFKNNLNNSNNVSNGRNRDVLLPALFLHGAYAGGRDEMRYLQANKVACDAIILHPNDVSLKNKFADRLERGRTRLRLYEEVNAMTH